MTIQDFVKQTKKNWDEAYRNRPASEVLLGPMKQISWSSTLQKAGYCSIILCSRGEWERTHQWCEERFGKEHYTWTGSTFWFETEQDAALFALRWA